MTKQFSSDLKLKAIQFYNKINNYSYVCKIFGCSERSLKRWIIRFNETGSVKRRDRQLGSYKLKQKHIEFIKNTLKNNNTIHMKLLHKILKDKYPKLKISRQYLSTIIRDNNITRKRATFKHFPKTFKGKPRDEKAELKIFYDTIKKYKLKNIISIDETSISTSLSYNYCRNDLGKRCLIKTDNNNVFKKYSLIVAINNKKCIKYKLYEEGAVNGERFNKFLKKICEDEKDKLIILDNGQIHKKEKTKNIIKDSGNNLVYTCPYSPRLNCIEQWFNQVKHYLKLYKSKNLKELKENLKKSIKKILKEHYTNYFIYAYKKKKYKNLIYGKSNKERTLKKYKQ
jgi:transposase